jgi:hypothetical protein
VESRLCFDDGAGQTELYPDDPPDPPDSQAWYVDNLRRRKEYLEPRDIQIVSLENLYIGNTSPFDANCVVLCDVFLTARHRSTQKMIGMPILYYKADVTKLLHDRNSTPFAPGQCPNIYNYWDNHELLGLGLPTNSTFVHPLFQSQSDPQGKEFYKVLWDKDTAAISRPYRKDSYVLISAGWDGAYGTQDDVYNFAK